MSPAADGMPTALVLHFRTVARTLRCAESLVQEGIRRIVIVDNSEDGGHSRNALGAGLDALDAACEAIVLDAAYNRGFAGGVDLGLGHVVEHGGGPVLLINSDALLAPGALAPLMAALHGNDVAVPWIAHGSAAATSAFRCYDLLLGTITLASLVAPLRYASGCCMLLADSMARPGLFDPAFFFYGEDCALAQRLGAEGRRVVECPSAVVLHAGAASAREGSLFYEYHMNRAHWLLALRVADPGPVRRLAVVLRCVMLPLRATLRCIRARSTRPWRALAMATFDVATGRCRSLTPPA